MMDQLLGMNEIDYLYGRRPATLFEMGWGIRIIGFKNGRNFDLRVLTVGSNPKRNGLGETSLKKIRPLFNEIFVNEIHKDALPFWFKMKDRGLIDRLGSIQGEINNNMVR